MTREEAIAELSVIWERLSHPEDCENGCYSFRDGDYLEALDMAIEALQAEPTKAVPPSLANVYKWERDIALSQLEEYGIGFAEKKRDDLVEVVRCKDCRWYKQKQKNLPYNVSKRYCNRSCVLATKENDYCSYGERREP